MITSGDLVDLLQQYDPRMEIIVSTDAEGNSFSDLNELSPQWTRSEGYEFEVLHPEDVTDWVSEDAKEGESFSETAQRIGLEKRLVVWPS